MGVRPFNTINIPVASNFNHLLCSEALQNNFPTRLSNIYIVNGGWIVKVLLGFAKLVFKKKMVKRVSFSY